MDGNNNVNNNVGGWAAQPVSFQDSQKAKTSASGQAGAFSNRTVISVPPNNTVVVLVPPTGLVSVEIKDRQVIVNTVNNLYMPYPMTPESGQILFDRGVATLAQNKGYSIAEAADMAGIGMKWAKANFAFDYSQAESQFMGWINGAPNRADNTRIEPAADVSQRTESMASASESPSTPTAMSATDAAVNPRPSTAPAALASDGDVESAPASGDDIYATVGRPSTAPAAPAADVALGEDDTAAQAMDGGDSADVASVSGDNIYATVQRPASAPAATSTEAGNNAATASEAVIPKARPASAENGVSVSAEGEASDGGQIVGSGLPDNDDYLDGVADLFAEPETVVDNKNTVASAESMAGDIVSDTPPGVTADVSVQSEEINIADDDVAKTSVDRPSTAPAAFTSAQIAEPATAEPVMVQPSAEPGRPASAPAATSTDSVADAASTEDAAMPGQRPASAPAASGGAENGVSVSAEREASGGGQMVGQSSGLPDNDDYLDGVADLFAEPQTVVDNKNTVASAESMADDIVPDNPSGVTADVSVQSEEINIDDNDVAKTSVELEDADTPNMDAGQTNPTDEDIIESASLSGQDVDVTVDRPSTAPAALASAPMAEPAAEPIMVQSSAERPVSAPAATSADSVADTASTEEVVMPRQRPASAPAALGRADNGVSASTEGEVSGGQMVGQSSDLPDNDDYLDGVADLFAEPETVVDNKNTVAPAESMAANIVPDSPSDAVVDDLAESDEINVDDGYFSDQEMNDVNTPKVAAGVTMSVQSESVAPSDSGDDLDPGYLADDEMEFGQDELNDGVDERMSATAASASSETEDDDGYFSDQEGTESMVVPPDTTHIREVARQRKAALQASNQQLDPAEVDYSGPAGSGKKIIDEPLDLSNVESSGYAKPNKLKMNFPVGSKEYREMVSDRKLLGVSSTYNEMSVARSAYKKLQENDSNLELSRDIVTAAEKYISFGVTGSKSLLREPDTVQQEALEALGLDKDASERAILLALINQTNDSLDVNKKTQHENRMKELDKIHKTLFGRG